MATLSRAQLYGYANAAGFSGAAADEVVAIAFAESGGNTQATHLNPPGLIGGVMTTSLDRGILQINDKWNPSVTDACAFDPTCSFSWAYKVSQGGKPNLFNAYWVTVQTGAYKKYLTNGSGGTTITPPTGGGTTTTPPTTGGTTTTPGGGGNNGGIPGGAFIPPTSGGANTLTTAFPNLAGWLVDPVRIIKGIVGITILILAIFLMFTTPEQKGTIGKTLVKAAIAA